MINSVKQFFGFGQCNPKEGTTIVINSEKLERRVALLEDGVLEEYSIEREGEDNIVGGIFKGRVKNIEPGLKAMFVDIGYEKSTYSMRILNLMDIFLLGKPMKFSESEWEIWQLFSAVFLSLVTHKPRFEGLPYKVSPPTQQKTKCVHPRKETPFREFVS